MLIDDQAPPRLAGVLDLGDTGWAIDQNGNAAGQIRRHFGGEREPDEVDRARVEVDRQQQDIR